MKTKLITVTFARNWDSEYPLDVRVPGQSCICRDARDALIYSNGVAVGLQEMGVSSRVLWAPGTSEVGAVQ